MSGDDDIRFDDVQYREPVRLRRPDRDRSFATIAYEVPAPDDMAIFLDHEVADRIERHALSDTSVELGGIILGRECVDDQTGQPFVWVSQMIEARHFENSQASFTYTHDSWQEITRERDRLHPDLDIVGWYHTHPDFGIFLSGHDTFIHQNFFAQPLQVAYVVDPVRQTRGFFVWKSGKLVQVGGYYIVSPRGARPALARVVDGLEGVEPEPGAAGSTLSPRLEAELIEMLRRPQGIAAAAGVDRGQTAAVFTLLGIVLGALGVVLALWIGALTQQVRLQSATLEEVRDSLAFTGNLQALARREAVVDAKESALAGLLREVRVGATSEDFLAAYTRAVQERDQAIGRAAMVDQVGLDLDEKNEQIARLQSEIAASEKLLARAEEEREELVEFRERAEELDARSERFKTLEKAAKDLAATKDPLLPTKYERAWYAALGGGALSVLLGLGLIATLARGPAPAPAPNRRDGGDLGGPAIRIGENPPD